MSADVGGVLTSKRKRKRFDEVPDGWVAPAEGEVKAAEAQPVETPAAVIEEPSTKRKREPVEEGVNPFTGRAYSDRYHDLLKTRQKLPAFEARKQFLKTVKKNQCVVLVGETGSGKTTQCAQFLLEAGYNKGKCIACTQPRRVAAMSVARRVAEEMDVELGKQVGYRIRFEDVCTPGVTILKYCTDGSLLREAQTNPSLDAYSIIMLDEAHERTLDTDILFGLLKDILKSRRDLKVIVMSATLDAGKFQDYFQAPIIHVPGRVHPVDILYTPKPESDYFEAALRTILQIHATEPPGDILLFLTGEEEIDTMKKSLERDSARLTAKFGELVVVPLHSSLPPQQQQRIFDKAPGPKYPGGPSGRKCVVSTNVAETSITIDGIVYVVDPGFSKQKVYNPRSRVESLLVSPISKASAKQRAGRAGRTQPGKCFRLYTEISYEQELVEQTYPEILRSNLGSVVLTLLKLGVENLVQFDFMEPPAPETMMRALEQLNYLGALSDEGQLTPEGELMAEFPLDPQLARMLIESATHQCTSEMLTLTAMLSVPQVFLRPKDQAKEADAAKAQFIDEAGDHLTLLNVFEAYKSHAGQEKDFCWEHYLHPRSLAAADKIRDQLVRIYDRLGLESVSMAAGNERQKRAAVRKGLLAGFFMQVAHTMKGSVYFTIPDNQAVALHPSTVIKHQAEWVLYHEFVMTSKNFIRTCTEVDGQWLAEISPKFWDLNKIPDGDARRRLVQIRQRK